MIIHLLGTIVAYTVYKVCIADDGYLPENFLEAIDWVSMETFTRSPLPRHLLLRWFFSSWDFGRWRVRL